MKKGGDNLEMTAYSNLLEAITKNKIEACNDLLKRIQVYRYNTFI